MNPINNSRCNAVKCMGSLAGMTSGICWGMLMSQSFNAYNIKNRITDLAQAVLNNTTDAQSFVLKTQEAGDGPARSTLLPTVLVVPCAFVAMRCFVNVRQCMPQNQLLDNETQERYIRNVKLELTGKMLCTVLAIALVAIVVMWSIPVKES